MDKLSPEILSLVVDHLDTDRLSCYATISRAWQHEVERRCFRNVELTVENMSAFPGIFARLPHRRSYLRRITLALQMERLDDETVSHFVTEHMVFRRCLTSLLATLKQWEEDEDTTTGSPTRANLELRIQPSSGRTWDAEDQWDSPLHDPRLSYLLEDPVTARILKNPVEAMALDVWLRVEHLTLSLMDGPLPTIRRVQSLSVEGGKVGPSTVPWILLSSASCEIAAAFPSLESFRFEYRDGFRDRYDEQVVLRSHLVSGLELLHGQLPSLKRLEIKRISPDCVLNHDYYPDHLDDHGIDLVSQAIRRLAQPTVQELVLDNFFLSRDLLCNRHGSTDEKEEDDDIWRALRRLDVGAQLVAPDGEWYTTGLAPATADPLPDGPVLGHISPWDGDVACKPWRRSIDSNTTGPLLEDLTRVAHERMPRLRELTIDLHSTDNLDDYLSVWSIHGERDIRNREDWDNYEPRLRVSCQTEPCRQWTVDRYLGARDWYIPRSLQWQWDGFAGKDGVVVTDIDEDDYVIVERRVPSHCSSK
ncbi:hypothetical protein PG991_001205 [Apiospora marii]|uniref:F-box domain-containing protein n=1 Tax=Apiospora marii TaxID=335849 RepID=A0ABR1SU62_9PEZI